MEEYRVRIADQLLSESLEALGAVLVQGTKWCGKTTTSVHHAGSVLYMDDPMQKEQNLSLAQTNIKRLLEGDTPRVIEAVSPHRKTLHHTFSAAPAATYCLLPTLSTFPQQFLTHGLSRRWFPISPCQIYEAFGRAFPYPRSKSSPF